MTNTTHALAHRARRHLVVALSSLAVCATLAGVARADIVTDWNTITLQLGGTAPTRTLAMVHIAMFDALNSIYRSYAPYHSLIDAPEGTSPEAAAASAAHGILVRRFPAQTANLDAALAASVAGIPNGAGKTAGLALGDQVAAQIDQLRSHDNILLPNPAYVPISGAGMYQLTPPGFAAPVQVAAATWLPFVMDNTAQFRPNGPRTLQHPSYAKEFEEVKALGSIGSLTRTAEQTISALWYIELPHPAMNRIARAESLAANLDLLSNARLFALLNIAMSDGTTSVFEAKYVFNFWRPVTAIRAADDDSNPDTTGDAGWTPFLVTPPHPEYPSAHSVIDTAAIQVLEAYFGPRHTFSTTSSSAPGIVRTFGSFREYGEEGQVARIYGGIHFRTAVEEGARQGKQLGNFILEHALLPVR